MTLTLPDRLRPLLALILACIIWGLSGLFYKALDHLEPLEILAHRTLWSALLFMGLLAMQGRLNDIGTILRTHPHRRYLLLAALIIALNWFGFIYAVTHGYALEASFGYYIFPLLAALLGWAAFTEPLRNLQKLAILTAALAVLILGVGLGVVPWISLGLAISFAAYGMLKKTLNIGPIMSVGMETLLLLPLAIGWLIWLHQAGQGSFGNDWLTSLLLVLAGPMTAIPLILFSYASRRLKLATVGMTQYLNPTLQFFVAVLIFGEAFSGLHLTAFAGIWLAISLYSADAWRAETARKPASISSTSSQI